jgi:hypothetical protein
MLADLRRRAAFTTIATIAIWAAPKITRGHARPAATATGIGCD